MTFDQAQSPRLGQRQPPELPGVRVLTIETLPEVAFTGQIVYLLDLHSIGIFDGTGWQILSSGTGGGTSSPYQVFVLSSEPTADNLGDLWFNPITHELKVWNGTAWVLAIDPAIYAQLAASNAAALDQIAALQGIVDAKTTTYYQPSAPVGAEVNDLWFNTTTNKAAIYTLVGGVLTWKPITDPDINAALAAAGTAQATADGKISHYVQAFAPWANGAAGHDADKGDIWTNTAENNKEYYWTGAGTNLWAPLPVGAGAVASGALNGTVITGATVRTDAGSSRMEMLQDSGGGVIKGWTPTHLEPATINPDAGSNFRLPSGPNSVDTRLSISSGRPTPGVAAATMLMTSDSVDGPAVTLTATTIKLIGLLNAGTATFSGNVNVTHPTANPSLTVDGTLHTLSGLVVGLGATVAGSVVSSADVKGNRVFAINPDTADPSLSANVRILGGGQFAQLIVSSAAKYKDNITPAEIDPAAVLAMEPVTFTYKPEVTPHDTVLIGFIADQAHELGLHHFVEYQDGEVESIRYDRWAVAQQAVLRAQQAEIDELKAAVAALTASAE